MNAIVLSAGIGSRLKPLTDSKPKTMVEVNGTPMIGYIIRALARVGASQIVICTGYLSQVIREYCGKEFPSLAIRFVENEDYLTTNNMYSLYLAREFLDGDCLIMNGDLCFDADILELLIAQKATAFAVDVGRYLGESMKVMVRGGHITGISKALAPDEAYGCSIDIYRIATGDTKLLVGEMHKIIEAEHDRNQWTEVMLHRLCSTGRLRAKPVGIGSFRWYEIDDFRDLGEAELLFNPHVSKLKGKKVFFLDRDGTLAIEGKAIPGAIEFVKRLREMGMDYFVLSNNSSKTPRQHFQSLQRCGFPLSSENVLVSTDSAAQFLVENGLHDIFWVASENVGNYLAEAHGLKFESVKPSAVLLTYDDTIDYKKLVQMTKHLRNGVRYFATHTDVVCPTQDGPIPDIGTFIELLRLTTGRSPEKIFGKPSGEMIAPVLKRLGCARSDAVVVGDRLYTDLALAVNADVNSVLVLTGETNRAEYEQQPRRADIVVEDLGRLIEYL
jgi:HAD superfamily hydrolase (TIGR01450 family)